MKTVLWTFVAVVGGIWLYMKLTGRKVIGGSVAFGSLSITPADTAGAFYGPDIDPVTGAYLNVGAKPGTVEFAAQGN